MTKVNIRLAAGATVQDAAAAGWRAGVKQIVPVLEAVQVLVAERQVFVAEAWAKARADRSAPGPVVVAASATPPWLADVLGRLADAVEALAAREPVVNVTVEIPEPAPTRKVIERDAFGLISAVRSEPAS